MTSALAAPASQRPAAACSADSKHTNPNATKQGPVNRGKTTTVRRFGPREDAARRGEAGRRGRGDDGPDRPQRDHRQVVRRSDRHQGRRDGEQGNRAGRPFREHGGQAGQRGGLKDLGRGRRRHDDRHGAGPRHLQGRHAQHRRRQQPDGRPPRHRKGRRSRHQEAPRDGQARVEEGRNRPGRLDQRQQRPRNRRAAGRRDGKSRQGRRDHRRRRQDHRNHQGARRGHAVRQGLHLAVLHQPPGRDGLPARRRPDPDPRKEDRQSPRAGAAVGKSGPLGQAAADHCRGRRRRGPDHAGRQQAARRAQRAAPSRRLALATAARPCSATSPC